MKIAAVTTSFPRNADDHAGRFVFDLHAGLREEGHEVLTVCPAAIGIAAEEEAESGRVVRVRYAPEREQDLFYGDGLEENWRRVRAGRRKLRTFLRAAQERLTLEQDAEVVVAHWLWPSGVAAVRAGHRLSKPVIGVGHGGDLHLLGKPVLGGILSLGLRRGFTAALCTSRAGAEVARRRLGIPTIAVAAMGADPARFRPDAGPRIEGWPEGYLFGAGRLVPLKGFDLLVQAGASLHRPVVIAGEGPERDRLRSIALATGTQLVLPGRLGPTGIARAMAHAAAVVVPSRILSGGRTEGCPVVIVEALLCGAPVVASAVGGIPDLLPREATFPPGAPETLTAALVAALARGRMRRSPPPGCTRRETARTLLSLLR